MIRFITSLLLMVCVSCTHTEKMPETERSVKCDTAKTADNYNKESKFPGRVKAANDINVAFRISGPILSIKVDQGDFVRKGALLAQMDERDYKTQLAATQAEYNRIKAEADRIIELYKKESVSPNDYDKALYGLKQITSKLEAHTNALSDTRLLAPFDGYIQKKHFDAGETVSAGMPVISMISKDMPEIEINIPTSDFVNRADYASATCRIDVFGDKEFPLDLIGINQKANLNQLYTTRFRFKNKEKEQAAPGMSAMVTIRYRSEANRILSIPASSLVGDMENTKVWIFSNGKVNSRKVKVSGITTNGYVYISDGLNEGDIVVTAGTKTLEEGQKVKPLSQKSSTNVGGLL